MGDSHKSSRDTLKVRTGDHEDGPIRAFPIADSVQLTIRVAASLLLSINLSMPLIVITKSLLFITLRESERLQEKQRCLAPLKEDYGTYCQFSSPLSCGYEANCVAST